MKLEPIAQLVQEKKYSKTLKAISKVKANDVPTRYKVSYYKALCFVNLDNSKMAILTLQEAIKFAPEQQDKSLVIALLVQEYSKANKFTLAKTLIEEWLVKEKEVLTEKVLIRYCEICLKLEEFDQAIKVAKGLQSGKSFKPEIQKLICNISFNSLDKDATLQCLLQFREKLEDVSPKFLAYVCQTYMDLNEFVEAENLLNKFIQKYQTQSWFKVLRSRVALEAKEYDHVINLLGGVTDDRLPEWLTPKNQHLRFLAQAHEKLGSFEQSFEYYSLLSQYNLSRCDIKSRRDHLKDYDSIDITKLVSSNNLDYPTPVFMIGFPRSGSTLLETVVDTHSGIVSLSEPKTISAVIHQTAKLTGKPYPKSLGKLKEDDISELRDLYFREVSKLIGDNYRGKLLVDKMPLNTGHLPLINMLFSDAKYIVNIRHPLDVIYSNFQQDFVLNYSMSFLITLQGTARRYLQVFDFYDKCKKILKLQSIEVHYENVLENMDEEVRKLTSFLTLPFEDGYKNYQHHAQNKIINTASNNQVSKPIYKTSMFKWVNYKEQLKDISPIVEKYIAKFGYSAE